MDARVQAIRDDKRIGVGTCSTVDECYTDEELIALMDEHNITDPATAVKYLREVEDVWDEIEDDIRGYGNVSPLHSPREPGRVYDDDPEAG